MTEQFPDRYELVRPLGSGGMSDVFLVKDQQGGELRALKRLRFKGLEAEALIRDEFARLARIRHDHIVQVFDYGTLPDGSPFFTMEHLEGKPLDEAIAPGDVAGALRAMRDVLAGLSALHAAGLLHCDLHASNLRVVANADGSSTTRILDLGLAGRVNDQAGERVRGRAGYVAPEVLAHAPYSRESDYYALGATLYRVLTGRPAFPGRDPAEILAVQERGAPALLPLRTSNVPPPLQTLILQLLSTEPGHRASAASELGELAARRSQGAAARTHDVLRGFGPLVGREDALAGLRRHLLGGDRLCAAALFGAHGSGRTRLARELAIEAELAGWNVLWFDASRLPAMAQAPSGQTLLIADDVDAWPESASQALGALAAGLDGALLFIQGRRPAEGDTVYRVLLALDDPPAPAPFALGPLEPAAAEQFAAQRLGGSISPEDVQRMIAHVGSLPGSILVELDRWISSGALVREGDRWRTREIGPGDANPSAVKQDMGEALAAGLSPSARVAGFIVACWPPADALSVLAHAAGIGEAALVAGIDELEWAGVLQVDGSRRRIVPEALARSLRGDREYSELQTLRRSLHDALETRMVRPDLIPDAEPIIRAWCQLALANHELALGEDASGRTRLVGCIRAAINFDQVLAESATEALMACSHPGDAQHASDLVTISGDWAKRESNVRAEQLLTAAIEFLPPTDALRRAEWSVEHANLLMNMGRYASTLQILDRVLPERSRTGISTATVGRALSIRGWCRIRTEREGEGLADLREAIHSLPAQEHKERTLALMRLGISLYLANQEEEGADLLEQCLAMAVGQPDPQLEARVRGNVALRYRIEGDLDRADAECRAGLARIGERGTTRQHYYLTSVLLGSAYDRRDWNACMRAEDAMEAISRDSGNPSAKAGSLHSRTIRSLLCGNLPAAIDAIARERPWLAGAENLEQRYYWSAQSGIALSWLGEERAAWRRLLRSKEESSKARLVTPETLAARGLAEIALLKGRFAQAGRLYRFMVGRQGSDPATLLAAGLGLARIGLATRSLVKIREGREVLGRLTHGAAIPDFTHACAEIDAYELALSNQPADAELKMASVLAGLRSLDLAPREIQAAWNLGRALQTMDPPAAERLLKAAHTLAQRCGIQGWSRRIAEDRLAAAPIQTSSPVAESEFLPRAIELMNSLQEFPTLLQRSLDLAAETVGADRGFILLHEEGDSGLRVVAACGNVDEASRSTAHEVSRTIVKRVARTGETFLTDDAGEDPRLGSTQSLLDLAVRSLLCIPLRLRDRVIGTIYLESRVHTGQFSVDDRDLLESFAHLVAVAIENGRLHDELKRSRERVIRENLSLRQDVSKKFARPNIIAQSAQMERVLDEAERFAMSRISVHIAGATGTGKELIAKHIHYESPRAEQPFVAVNCGAINKDLLEVELFGIVSGAASNVTEHHGFFERANGGTLFLDEIGDMPLDVQIKLLRVLEEREFTPVRGTRVIRTDFRLISATNQDLRQLMQDGAFRSDLFFRLHGHEIRLPLLRERPVDIPILAEHFLQKFCAENGLPVPRISPRFMSVILNDPWPGNVRDLRNYVENCVLESRGPQLEPVLRSGEPAGPRQSTSGTETSIGDRADSPGNGAGKELRTGVRDFERTVLVQGLEQASWNQRRAAGALGLSESTLRAKMRTHDIKSPPGQQPKRGRPTRSKP